MKTLYLYSVFIVVCIFLCIPCHAVISTGQTRPQLQERNQTPRFTHTKYQNHSTPSVYLANRTVRQESLYTDFSADESSQKYYTSRNTRIWIVQLAFPPTDKTYSLIASNSVHIAGYIPENAFMVEATDEQLSCLNSLPCVQGICEYTTDDRLSSSLKGFTTNALQSSAAAIIPASFLENHHIPEASSLRDITASRTLFDSVILEKQYANALHVENEDEDNTATNTPTRIVAIHVIHTEYMRDVRQCVEDNGGSLLGYAGKGMHKYVYASITPATCIALTKIAGVQFIEPADYIYDMYNDVVVSSAFINADTAWNTYGLTGRGQIIGHCDSGLDTGNVSSLHPDFTNQLRAVYSLREDGKWNDPYGHGTHTAGTIMGNGSASVGQFKGVAHEAELVHQSAYYLPGSLYISTNLYVLFEQPYADGARIHADSWGQNNYPGQYTSSSRDVDSFSWDHPDMLLVFAVGNDGTDENIDGVADQNGFVSVPATAKNSIAVGAAETIRSPGSGGYTDKKWAHYWENDFPVNPIHDDYVSYPADEKHIGMSARSSRGPCNDGRIKPDVVAPGTDVISCRSHHPDASVFWGAYNNDYVFAGGSSMAVPQVAGAAALLRQYCVEQTIHTNPSAALIKALLISGARSLYPGQYGYGKYAEIPFEYPNATEGWGMINIGNSLGYTVIEDGHALFSGEEYRTQYTPASNEVIKATLVWTDMPALAGAGIAIVNDLDLFIIAPDGSTNYANNSTSPDRINTTETCSAKKMSSGVYDIVVRAHSVVPSVSQCFALVVHTASAPESHQKLEELRHEPEPVTPDTPALVSADIVTNNSGLFSAQLLYRVNSGTWVSCEMSLANSFPVGITVTSMIPSHVLNTYVEYFAVVEAVDGEITYSTTNTFTVIDAYVCVFPEATPTPPYQDWSTAFTTITDAYNYVDAGWRIDVTGGIYGVSSIGSEGLLINKKVYLRAVEGPEKTALDGELITRPLIIIARGAIVEGFTIWNGYASSSLGGAAGGGVYLLEGIVKRCNIRNNIALSLTTRGGGVVMYYKGLVDSCKIFNNTAAGPWAGYGGGVACYNGGVVRSCSIYGNSAPNGASYGGGLYLNNGGTVSNSTIAGNSAVNTGGIYSKGENNSLHNCIVYDNRSGNLYEDGASMKITWSVLSSPHEGTGNINISPGFINASGSDYHLSASSFCLNSGTNLPWMNHAYDADGNARILDTIVDRGGYERGALKCSFNASKKEGLAPLSVTFTAYLSGTNTAPTYYRWDFDGDGSWDSEGWGDNPVNHTYSEGLYDVYLNVENTAGESAYWYLSDYIVAYDTYTHHIANGGKHIWPFTSWENAATNAADAFSAADNNHTILISNGVYMVYDIVNIQHDILVTSFHGAAYTTLRGTGSKPVINCYNQNSLITGITCENGNSGINAGGINMYAGTVRDCIFQNNQGYAGGVWLEGSSRMYDCVFRYNGCSILILYTIELHVR